MLIYPLLHIYKKRVCSVILIQKAIYTYLERPSCLLRWRACIFYIQVIIRWKLLFGVIICFVSFSFCSFCISNLPSLYSLTSWRWLTSKHVPLFVLVTNLYIVYLNKCVHCYKSKARIYSVSSVVVFIFNIHLFTLDVIQLGQLDTL